jgi:hypothetical protein
MRRLRSLFRTLDSSVARPAGRAARDLLGLVPALLAGAGVFLVVAGLFYYLQPASADSLDATPAPSQSVAAYTLPPLASLSPSAGTSVSVAIATRVRVPALNIDEPVVASPPNEEFPLCNAAEYEVLNDVTMAFPGLPQATYIYAHARTAGMFLPLLLQARVNDGAAMIGMYVEVYTADNQRHVYEITKVIRHVPPDTSAFDAAIAAKTDELWLQTSEGTIHDPYKMQVVAEPVGVLAASAADAHPVNQGNVCPDAPKCKTANGSGCKR